MVQRKNAKAESTQQAAASVAQPDLYATLCVDRGASNDEIKASYRKLALKHHPDKNPGDAKAHDSFQQISIAYSVLSDVGKRRYYDKHGTTDELDTDPREFVAMFQGMLMEMLGGAHALMDMMSGLSVRELSRLPPFPFPKELFPPGTFPQGVRFSSEGLQGMPPSVEEMLANPEELAALLAEMPGARGGRAGGSRARQRAWGRDSKYQTQDDDDESSGEWTEASSEDEESCEMPQEVPVPNRVNASADAMRREDVAAAAVSPASSFSPAAAQKTTTAHQSTTTSSSPTSNFDSGSNRERQQQPQQQQQQQSHQQQQQQPLSDPAVVRDWLAAARGCDLSLLLLYYSREPRLLLAKGPGLGQTALHWLAAKGSSEGVAWMLSRGAPVGLTNAEGATPLHSAARNGQLEVARLLIAAAGSNSGSSQQYAAARQLVETLDSDNCSAQQLAVEYKHDDVASYLDQVMRQGQGLQEQASKGLHLQHQSAIGSNEKIKQTAGEDVSLQQRQPEGEKHNQQQASHPSSACQQQFHLNTHHQQQQQQQNSAHAKKQQQADRQQHQEQQRQDQWTQQPQQQQQEQSRQQRQQHQEEKSHATNNLDHLQQQQHTSAGFAASSPAALNGSSQCSSSPHLPDQAVSPATASAPHSPGTTGPDRPVVCTADGAGISGSTSQSAFAPASAGNSIRPVSYADPATNAAAGAAAPAAATAPSAAPAVTAATTKAAGATSAAAAAAAATAAAAAAATAAAAAAAGGVDAKARRRAALLADAEAADKAEEKEEAEKEAAAVAAAAAVGVSREQGRAWLESAKEGRLAEMQAMLFRGPQLLAYAGQGTSLGFTGHTALHWASAKGHIDVVRWLIGRGAPVEAGNKSGNTALHAAATNEQLEVVAALVVEGGADVMRVDDLGDTPRDVLLGKQLHTAVANLDLLVKVAQLQLLQPQDWSVRNMRILLALAKVDVTGFAEKGEYVAACVAIVARHPKRILATPRIQTESTADRISSGGNGSGGSYRESQQHARAGDGTSGSSKGTREAVTAQLPISSDNSGAPGGGGGAGNRISAATASASSHSPPSSYAPSPSHTSAPSSLPHASANPSSAPAVPHTSHNTQSTTQPSFCSTPSSSAAHPSNDSHHTNQDASHHQDHPSSSTGGAQKHRPATTSLGSNPPSQPDNPDCIHEASQDGNGTSASTAESDGIHEGANATASSATASESAKLKGNAAFAAELYPKALSHYSMALRLSSEPSAVLFSNRAAAYAGMKYFGKSLDDADAAVALQPGWPKGHCRRGVALAGQKMWKEAVQAFKKALDLDPTYSAAREGLSEALASSRE